MSFPIDTDSIVTPPIIHKRMSSTRLCESRCYTLCDPSQLFERADYNWQNPRFVEWQKTNKAYWKFVTCPECLKRRKFM